MDEGFGSLDGTSLQRTTDVLDRLGIISYVGALKERIDRQCLVTRQKTGGSAVEIRAQGKPSENRLFFHRLGHPFLAIP